MITIFLLSIELDILQNSMKVLRCAGIVVTQVLVSGWAVVRSLSQVDRLALVITNLYCIS